MTPTPFYSALLGMLMATTAQAQYTDTPPFEQQGTYEKSGAGFMPGEGSFRLASLAGQETYLKIAEANLQAQAPPTEPAPDPEAATTEPVRAPEPMADTEATDLPVPEVDVSFTIEQFIGLVRERNEQLIAQRLEINISREAVNSAKSKFEPEAVASYQNQVSEQNYTKEEKAQAPFFTFSNRDDRYHNYNATVQGLTPTGGTMSLGYALNDISNLYNVRTGHEFQTNLVAEVTQPLLKNAGIKTTMADINLAEAESRIAVQTFRQQMMQVVYDAAAAYWDLAFAQEKHKLSLDSLKIADKILFDSRERAKLGKIAETDVLEAQAGLAARRSQELAARAGVNAAANNLRNFISSSAVDSAQEVATQSQLANEDPALDLQSSVARALESRPDYVAALHKLEREDIRVAFTKNQRFPQLDLKGSYGLNGLEYGAGDSFENAQNGDNPFWTVGVEFRVPLGGGKKTKSELAAAKYRKRQALLEVKSLETSIKNAIHTSVGNVESAVQQTNNFQEVTDLKKRLLEVEMTRLQEGKSNSQEILKKEEEFYQAQTDFLSSLVANNKALLGLELMEGSLLERYAVEIPKEGR